MLEGKQIWVLGGLLIIVGSILLFFAYLTSMVGVCGDPVPGCYGLVNVEMGILSMSVLAAGLGFLTIGAHRRMGDSMEYRMRFLAIAAFFVLSLIILFTVFNPLISPYDSIRDSDLDGYTDNIDAYPHDQSRHFAPYLQLMVDWENTTTNYSVTITDIHSYVYVDQGPLSRIVLAVRWYAESYFAYTKDIAPLDELDGVWIDGATYTDNAPINELSANDTFSFDASVYYVAFEPMLKDDAGHVIAFFSTV